MTTKPAQTSRSPEDAPSRAPGLLARASEALRFQPRERVALAVLALLVVSGGALAYVRSRPAPAAVLAPIATPSPAVGARVWVHVVGAVRNQGVYSLREGARVIDAIRAAGGFVQGADGTAINLARAVADGEQIVVPRRGEASPAAAGGGAGGGGKVNINSAGVSELDALPGIGPVLAQRIVDYREQHGPFRDVRDLMKVPGIGPRKFESLEMYVTV